MVKKLSSSANSFESGENPSNKSLQYLFSQIENILLGVILRLCNGLPKLQKIGKFSELSKRKIFCWAKWRKCQNQLHEHKNLRPSKMPSRESYERCLPATAEKKEERNGKLKFIKWKGWKSLSRQEKKSSNSFYDVWFQGEENWKWKLNRSFLL